MDIDLKLSVALAYNDMITYDVRGDLNGSIEVQFDNGEFNGVILYSEDGQPFGDETWKQIKDKKTFNYVKEKAIKDYNGINN